MKTIIVEVRIRHSGYRLDVVRPDVTLEIPDDLTLDQAILHALEHAREAQERRTLPLPGQPHHD